MALNEKIGRGSLGVSRRQTNPNAPSHIGSLTFEGGVARGEKLYLSAWVKSDDQGRKYFSIVVERPQPQERQVNTPPLGGQRYQNPPESFGQPQRRPQLATTNHGDMDDEIPF